MPCCRGRQFTLNVFLSRTQRQLALQDTNAQAEKKFKQEIQNALKTVSRQFDNMVHNIVHS